MTLYSYYRSSCSYRVRIALEHKNLPYEYKSVHLLQGGGQQLTPEFTSQINSKNEVPVLEDKGVRFSQSTAIFFYLDRMHMAPPLFPKSFPEFEKCIELVELINSGIQPLQNLAVLKKLKSEFKINEEEKQNWIRHFIQKGLESYQSKLDTSCYFSISDDVSAADMFLIPQMYNAHRFQIDFSNLDHLLKIEKHCLSLDCFKKAHPDAQPDAPQLSAT